MFKIRHEDRKVLTYAEAEELLGHPLTARNIAVLEHMRNTDIVIPDESRIDVSGLKPLTDKAFLALYKEQFGDDLPKEYYADTMSDELMQH